MANVRWPRTLHGWRTLFWLALGRCPIHRTRLNIDNPLYDDGRSAYCFRCDGVAIWPQGAREALRQNYRAIVTIEQAQAYTAAQVADAVTKEQEAIEKIVDSGNDFYKVAAAIRARGQV